MAAQDVLKPKNFGFNLLFALSAPMGLIMP
jgi:hypothetical protein